MLKKLVSSAEFLLRTKLRFYKLKEAMTPPNKYCECVRLSISSSISVPLALNIFVWKLGADASVLLGSHRIQSKSIQSAAYLEKVTFASSSDPDV